MDVNSPFYTDKGKFSKPKYKGFEATSHYITARDGVKIAAEVLLPKGLKKGQKVPTILIQTRYWRAIQLKKPFCWLVKFATNPMIAKKMVKHGYAVVETDVRGTGASEGNRPYPVSKDEVKDGADVTDWILEQHWCDGNVMVWGNSYTGMTAELAMSLGHPAIKGAIIRHDPWDLFEHAMFPGGCFNEAFIGYWSKLGKGLDQMRGIALREFLPIKPLFAKLASKVVKGVKPVNDNYEDFPKIAKIHANNNYPFDYGEKVTFKDDPTDIDGTTVDDISIFSKQPKIEKLNRPFFTFGSWQDSGTSDASISRFMSFKNPIRAIIGDWDHEMHHKANPYHSHNVKAVPPPKYQVEEWINMYEECLNDKLDENILYYYTMGEEKWKKTKKWPPEGQIHEKWYFRERNLLSEQKPDNNEGNDEYKVDYSTTTGIRNRWYTLLSTPVFYPDRETEDAKCLSYTSAPLEQDIEVTGHPIITLYLKSTHEDGMIHAHLEFLDDEGNIHWITDGQLRFNQRKISDESPPYKIFVPYHSCKREDRLPYTPGEIIQLKFGMFPTSIVIKKGYRLRVVIAGADKDSFHRYPEEGNPTLTILRNSAKASLIELPIIKKS